ncbi:MAG: hypothetical protein ACRDLL_04650 [Solirubrobacterales bacterium]
MSQMPGTCAEIDAADGPNCNLNQAGAMSGSARRARAVAGFGFLAIAGALSSRQAPGRVALWPLALVPTWFGISHLVAGVIGYWGCPELGAIPSVMLARRVPTGCGPWERIDGWLASPYQTIIW